MVLSQSIGRTAGKQPSTSSSHTQRCWCSSASTPPVANDSSAAKPESVPPVSTSSDASHSGSATQEAEKPVGVNQEPAPKSVTPASDNAKPVKTQADSTQTSPRKRKTAQAQPDSEQTGNVESDGFTRAEIPDLLRKDDAAAGRGDSRNARYEYGIVLRLDRQNAAAHEGLRRVQEAEKEKAQE